MGQSTGAFQTFYHSSPSNSDDALQDILWCLDSGWNCAHVAYILDETGMQGASECTLAAYSKVFNAPHKSP